MKGEILGAALKEAVLASMVFYGSRDMSTDKADSIIWLGYSRNAGGQVTYEVAKGELGVLVEGGADEDKAYEDEEETCVRKHSR